MSVVARFAGNFINVLFTKCAEIGVRSANIALTNIDQCPPAILDQRTGVKEERTSNLAQQML